LRIYTDNPSELPSWYLDQVAQRVADGTANGNDQEQYNEFLSREFAKIGNLISYGAGKLISSGVIFEKDLLKLVPMGMENKFNPSERISEGFKYGIKINGVHIEVKL
jgi:hypothetical protein